MQMNMDLFMIYVGVLKDKRKIWRIDKGEEKYRVWIYSHWCYTLFSRW